ncbi:MAG: hypothetical protein QW548_01680 [Candidatus Aenigmatarchaeota archaeon]
MQTITGPPSQNLLLKVFRQYDIRGIYPTEINEQLFERIGRAYATIDAVQRAKQILVAHDVRCGSPQLALAFMRGIASAAPKAKRVFAGALPIGAAMFYANKTGSELAYVTASHLPPDWNGLKLFHPDGKGWLEPENVALRDAVPLAPVESAETKHTVVDPDSIITNYIHHLVTKIKPKRRLRVVLDCGNGAASMVAPRLFATAGFEVKALWAQPDGRFPNRSPDPLADPLTHLKEAVRLERASLGIAYDGDGDRMVIVDDTGEKVSSENASAIILEELLKTAKGPLIATAECSCLIEDLARRFGRPLIRVPVGHTHLIEAVHSKGAAFGVEISGHYAIPSLAVGDDSLAISYYLACVVSSRNVALSSQLRLLPSYPCYRENFVCADEEKFAVLERMKAKLAKRYGSVDDMDGLRVVFTDGWALIRASNTEPKIRLTVEARTQDRLSQLKADFTKLLEHELRCIYKPSLASKLRSYFGSMKSCFCIFAHRRASSSDSRSPMSNHAPRQTQP